MNRVQLFPFSLGGSRGRAGGSRIGGRLMMALVVAAISLFSYFKAREYNPVTDEVQHVSMSVDQETALGLQAAPEMAAQYGGIDPDPAVQARVTQVGQRVHDRSTAASTAYHYEYHVLADDQTLNAFALPGGQVFITDGLLKKLRTEGELAGVLGHEIGHVVARHSAEHLAKAQLTQGLTGAAAIASYDPDHPSSRSGAAVAAMVGQLVNLRFGRQDELEADRLGVRFMSEAGYDPRAMLGVMEVLSKASRGGRQPEFFSTHPNPENRVSYITEAIRAQFPSGVPERLER